MPAARRLRFAKKPSKLPPRRPRHVPTASDPRAEYVVRAKVWLYSGAGGWHFVNLSARQSGEIRVRFGGNARGWGSLPVEITLGGTVWRTSIFPDRKSDTYLFAIKAEVRKREGVVAGSTIRALVRIR